MHQAICQSLLSSQFDTLPSLAGMSPVSYLEHSMPTSATPHRWVEDCVLNRDSLYLYYDQLVIRTEASTKISLYKVQRLCLVIVHHLQLQHPLFFSHTNTISLSTQHHTHNFIATINMHGPFNGHGHHEKDHGLLGKVFHHHH